VVVGVVLANAVLGSASDATATPLDTAITAYRRIGFT
jgi:hypothetical protein